MRTLSTACVFTTLFAASKAFLIPRDHGPAITVIPLKTVGDRYTAAVRMGPEGSPQKFNFAVSTTLGYTVVAGRQCNGCIPATSNTYDSSISSTYVAAPVAEPPINITVNGKNITGPLATEDCALKKPDGSWWTYNNQKIIVASPGTDSDVFGAGLNISGIAGFGQSNVQHPTDTLVGQYLVSHPNVSNIVFGMALNAPPAEGGSESDGGNIHLFNPDPNFFEGEIFNTPVATIQQQQNFGELPPQIGSYDWTVQMQGWTFQSNDKRVTGGSGVYATVEPAFPYIMLTDSDVKNIYATIPGAQPYAGDTEATAFTIPCDSTVSLSMMFGGLTVPVEPTDLFTKVGDLCVGNVRGWKDTTHYTYIVGSAFIRNAYVVFTAGNNHQANTIGFAKRLQAKAGAKKAEGGIIAGSVVGGLAFIGLIIFSAWLWVRRNRQAHMAPSATYSASAGSARGEKSFFGLKSSKEKEEDLAAVPWVPPTTNQGTQLYRDHNGDQVVVQPWTDGQFQDQALLSPSGTTFSHPSYTATTPPLSSHGLLASPGMIPPTNYHDPSGQHSAQPPYTSYQPMSAYGDSFPNSSSETPLLATSGGGIGPGGQVMWVESRMGKS